MSTDLQIVPIDGSHAELLSGLAKSIYREYYLHLWHPGGAEWYMDEHAYHPEILRAELEDSRNLHFMVYEASVPSGYLKLKLPAEPVGPGKDGLEIERIYLSKKMTGKGTGKQLMLLGEAIARERHQERIFLKAMDTSEGAIRFYRKMGYGECGKLVLPFPLMKEELRGMVIMEKKI